MIVSDIYCNIHNVRIKNMAESSFLWFVGVTTANPVRNEAHLAPPAKNPHALPQIRAVHIFTPGKII